MKPPAPQVESAAVSDFARIMGQGRGKPEGGQNPGGFSTPRLNIDEHNVRQSLAKLVLTLVKLLHQLLERQAIRRMDGGALTGEEIERLGLTLMKQAQEIERLRQEFGLEEADLNIDLGPLGKLL